MKQEQQAGEKPTAPRPSIFHFPFSIFHARRTRRASVLILVVALLVLMALIGTAYISSCMYCVSKSAFIVTELSSHAGNRGTLLPTATSIFRSLPCHCWKTNLVNQSGGRG